MVSRERHVKTCLLFLVFVYLLNICSAQCQTEGKFGESCQHECHCQGVCDGATGNCPAGCTQGFQGPTCQKRNVALRKYATSTSRYNNQWTADKAVDGDVRQTVGTGTCFHSASGRSPNQWSVNLSASYPMSDIVVYYRKATISRFNNTKIIVANASDNEILCATFSSSAGNVNNAVVRFNCSHVGSKLILRHDGSCGECILELCEVQIFVCTAGFHGDDCDQACEAGTYGENCLSQCGQCASATQCHSTDGICPQGCLPGWRGDTCHQMCAPGSYGQNCSLSCGHCSDGANCHHVDGSCPNGTCQPGYRGIKCDQTCTAGSYGSNCSAACGQCREGTTCHHVNGSCADGCQPEWTGDTCTNCSSGWYGEDCTRCGNCFNGSDCDVINGLCPEGRCAVGYEGGTCHQECPEGSFGQDCGETCAACASGKPCHHVNGSCVASRFSGGARTGISGTVLGAALGTVSLLVLLVVVTIVLLVRRRGKRSGIKAQENGDLSLTVKAKKAQGGLFLSAEGDEFSNLAFSSQESLHSTCTGGSITTGSQDAIDGDAGVYYNMTAFSGRADAASPSCVAISDLEALVARKKVEESFRTEYESVSSKFLAAYDVAQRKEHVRKNKFKSYYPYDFNRVLLEPTAGDPSSHYINASFVDGFERRKAFIAAQAPIVPTLSDFLRMIWQQQCGHVIMLTNLMEEFKVKCVRYWPESEGAELKCGQVTVTLRQQTEWSYCTLRQLRLTHESGETRTVKQFHFTTWPDHGVPSHVDMLDFFWKVRASWSPDSGPLLVHCSAGVGRTGTFIALWVLSDQAANQSRVDPLATLTALRHQRRNMIQTLSQYEFLHEALVRVVQLGRTAMDKEDFCSGYAGQRGGLLVGNRTLDQLAQDMPKLTAAEKLDKMDDNHIYSNAENSWDYFKCTSHLASVCAKRGFELVKLWDSGTETLAPSGLWHFLLETQACVLLDVHSGQGRCVPAPPTPSEEGEAEEKEGPVTLQWGDLTDLVPGVSSQAVQVKRQGQTNLNLEYVALNLTGAEIPGCVVAVASRLASEQLASSSPIAVVYRPAEEDLVQLVCAAVNLAETLRLDDHVELVSSLLRLHTSVSPTVLTKLAEIAYVSLQDDASVYANA